MDWDKTLGDVAKDLGNQLLTAARDEAGDAWEEIEEANREQISLLATFLGQLKVRELAGEDVSSEMAHVEAQIANLSFVNESIGARSVQAFWKKAAELSMSAIFNVAGKFVGL